MARIKAKAHKADIITTPKGERLAILPLDEYRRLVEESEDREIAEKLARARAGTEETLEPRGCRGDAGREEQAFLLAQEARS